MSTIPQFFVFDSLNKQDPKAPRREHAFAKLKHDLGPDYDTRWRLSHSDNCYVKVHFTDFRFGQSYTYGGNRSSKVGFCGNAVHLVYPQAACMVVTGGLGIGAEDFTLNFFFNALITPYIAKPFWPVLYNQGGLCMAMFPTVPDSHIDDLRIYTEDPYYLIDVIPRSSILPLLTTNKARVSITVARRREKTFVYLNETKISEVTHASVFNVPSLSEELFFFTTPIGIDSGNLLADTVNSGCSGGVVLYVGKDFTKGGTTPNVPYLSDPVLDLEQPLRENTVVGEIGRIGNLSRGLQSPMPFYEHNKIQGFNAFGLDHRPIIWFDASNEYSVYSVGPAYHPSFIRDLCEKTFPRQFFFYNQAFGFSKYWQSAVQKLEPARRIGTGIAFNSNELGSDAEGGLYGWQWPYTRLKSTFNAFEFSTYCVVGQAKSNANSPFMMLWDSVVLNPNTKVNINFDYTGTHLRLQIAAFTATVPLLMSIKESPFVISLRKLGNTWIIGVNGAHYEFEHAVPNITDYQVLWFRITSTSGPSLIFYEHGVYEHFFDDEESGKITNALLYKHGGGGGRAAKLFKRPVVETASGAIQKSKHLHRTTGREDSFYLLEEQQDMLLHIDTSKQARLEFLQDGTVSSYWDDSDGGRLFTRAPGEYNSIYNTDCSWYPERKTIQCAGYNGGLRSTKRIPSFNITMFFVGKMPHVLLQQGNYPSPYDQFYYGLGTIDDLQNGGPRCFFSAQIVEEMISWYGWTYPRYGTTSTWREYMWYFEYFGICNRTGGAGHEKIDSVYPNVFCITVAANGMRSIYLNSANALTLSGAYAPEWADGNILRLFGGQHAPYWSHEQEIAQFSIVSGVLSRSEINKCCAQLAHKWKLDYKLPSDSLYKNTPPLI